MGLVHSAASAVEEVEFGAPSVWVIIDEVDRVAVPEGCTWLGKAQLVNGELAMCLYHPERQDMISRYLDGEPVTIFEAAYAESRLSL